MAKKVLSTNKEAIVDKLALTIATTLQAVGQDTGAAVWPSPIFHPVEGDLYTAQYLMPILYQDLLKLEKKGFSGDKMARLLKAPSRIAQLAWLIASIGVADLTKKEKIDLTYRIVRLIAVFRQDPFCWDGRNILWSKEEVKGCLNKVKWTEVNKTSKQDAYRETINRLNGLAWLFCELLYSYIHGVGHEFHGPYLLQNEQILIVREYYDFKPNFWSFTSKLPFNKVTVFGIYGKVDISFDFFNRSKTEENLAPYLRKVAVELDDKGKFLNYRGIQQVIRHLEKISTIGVKEVGKLDRTALLKKTAETFFFIIKPIREKLGKDWLPPKGLYQSIEKEDKKEIVKIILEEFEKGSKLPKDEYIKVTAQAFNPRFQH